METKQNDTGKMSRTQKVIVVVTAVTLAVILILMLTTRFIGSGNTYPIGDSQENSSTQTTSPSESPEETEPDALSETDQPESGLSFGSVPNTPEVPELPGGLSPELPSGTGNTLSSLISSLRSSTAAAAAQIICLKRSPSIVFAKSIASYIRRISAEESKIVPCAPTP